MTAEWAEWIDLQYDKQKNLLKRDIMNIPTHIRLS